MRSSRLLSIVVAAAVSLAGFARVCSYETFNPFVCSVDVDMHRQARLHGRMTYGGQTDYAFTTRTLAPGPRR
jgi:hypothetical protein